MIVRCGRCQTSFEVSGPGRVRCPACGTTNEVRESASPDTGGLVTPPPAPEPDPPSPRVECPDCEFVFIVGEIDRAPCPNCGTSVTVGDVAKGDQ